MVSGNGSSSIQNLDKIIVIITVWCGLDGIKCATHQKGSNTDILQNAWPQKCVSLRLLSKTKPEEYILEADDFIAQCLVDVDINLEARWAAINRGFNNLIAIIPVRMINSVLLPHLIRYIVRRASNPDRISGSDVYRHLYNFCGIGKEQSESKQFSLTLK